MLRTSRKKINNIDTLIAGFLAGSSYLFHPNIGLCILAVTTILQVSNY